MERRRNPFGLQLLGFNFAAMILLLKIQQCVSLTPEGLALLRFRERVTHDPNGAFANWDPNDANPCMWLGVHCVDGKVQVLNLEGLWMEGVLGPELGELSHLRSLMLYRNRLSGFIPKEIGRLKMLELLDLRNNNLNGIIPAEIRMMPSLKHLLVSGNKIIPPKPVELDLLLELPLDHDHSFGSGKGSDCVNTKFGHCILESSLHKPKKPDSLIIPMVGTNLQSNFGERYLQGDKENCCDNLPSSAEHLMVTDVGHMVNLPLRRRLLESLNNLPAAPVSSTEILQPIIPYTQSSGGYPAVDKHAPITSDTPVTSPPDISPSSPNNTNSSQEAVHQPSAHHSVESGYFYAIAGVAFLFAFCAAVLFTCRNRAVRAIAPWRTGMSGRLRNALLEGVAKLERAELEAACEEFSNILETFPGCKLYKGVLSDGVEIGVASTTVESSKEWPKHADLAFKKRIERLSRIKHKNFTNILGYCQEDTPFTRMMVFEFAPNGCLSDHLHVKEFEHIDWTNRMRILMGVAYCLEHMHHVLNPPIVHPHLGTRSVLLTYDYAAKLAEINFWVDLITKSDTADEEQTEHSHLHPEAGPASNVYNFGIMMLEVISGKLPYTEEQGSILQWACQYLKYQEKNYYLIDPSLESFKKEELDVVCEIVQECIIEEPSQRPTMRDIASRLRSVTAISPEIATPSFSPLWRQELELEDGS